MKRLKNESICVGNMNSKVVGIETAGVVVRWGVTESMSMGSTLQMSVLR